MCVYLCTCESVCDTDSQKDKQVVDVGEEEVFRTCKTLY